MLSLELYCVCVHNVPCTHAIIVYLPMREGDGRRTTIQSRWYRVEENLSNRICQESSNLFVGNGAWELELLVNENIARFKIGKVKWVKCRFLEFLMQKKNIKNLNRILAIFSYFLVPCLTPTNFSRIVSK